MSEFPPSSDAVELTIVGDKIVLHCLLCGEDIGDASYLNEAVAVWRNHREVIQAKKKADL